MTFPFKCFFYPIIRNDSKTNRNETRIDFASDAGFVFYCSGIFRISSN